MTNDDWITNRLPTEADGDKNGYVLACVDDVLEFLEYRDVDSKTPWMPCPPLYVASKPDTSLAASIERYESAGAGGGCHTTGKGEESPTCTCVVCDKHRVLEAACKWDEQERQMASDFDAMTEMGFNDYVGGKPNDPDGVGEGWRKVGNDEPLEKGDEYLDENETGGWKESEAIERWRNETLTYRRRIETPEPLANRVTRRLPNASGVMQTTPTNCFSACVATLLCIDIADVPKGCDGATWDWDAFQDWLATRGLQAIEIGFGNGGTIYPITSAVPCILTGNSPRECITNRHAVVAKFIGLHGFECTHDPHASENWIDGEPTHAVFFVETNPDYAIRFKTTEVNAGSTETPVAWHKDCGCGAIEQAECACGLKIEPQGKPREWWIDHEDHAWEFKDNAMNSMSQDETLDEYSQPIHVREVNAAHDAWVEMLIELSRLLTDRCNGTEDVTSVVNRIREHRKARPQ